MKGSLDMKPWNWEWILNTKDGNDAYAAVLDAIAEQEDISIRGCDADTNWPPELLKEQEHPSYLGNPDRRQIEIAGSWTCQHQDFLDQGRSYYRGDYTALLVGHHLGNRRFKLEVGNFEFTDTRGHGNRGTKRPAKTRERDDNL
jgi:hypothetical protein